MALGVGAIKRSVKRGFPVLRRNLMIFVEALSHTNGPGM
jgi:hypothetical protein